MFSTWNMISLNKIGLYTILAMSLVAVSAACSKSEKSTSGVARINTEELSTVVVPANMAETPIMPRATDNDVPSN